MTITLMIAVALMNWEMTAMLTLWDGDAMEITGQTHVITII